MQILNAFVLFSCQFMIWRCILEGKCKKFDSVVTDIFSKNNSLADERVILYPIEMFGFDPFLHGTNFNSKDALNALAQGILSENAA